MSVFRGLLLEEGRGSKGSDQSRGTADWRMMFSWSLSGCFISVLGSNFFCVALCSYFYSILPTKRNLLTYLNSLFVIAMTAIVNIMVSESSDLEIWDYSFSRNGIYVYGIIMSENPNSGIKKTLYTKSHNSFFILETFLVFIPVRYCLMPIFSVW